MTREGCRLKEMGGREEREMGNGNVYGCMHKSDEREKDK